MLLGWHMQERNQHARAQPMNVAELDARENDAT